MKRIFLIVTISIISCIALSAREISTNPSTGLTLSENLGIYTISGKSGAIVLGNREATSKFLMSANAAFTTEAINHIYNFGDDEYTVAKDSKGMYIVKVGFGAVKLRPSDTVLFLTALGIKTTSDVIKNTINKVKDIVSE